MVRIKSTLISAVSLLAFFAAAALSQAQPSADALGKDAQLRQCLNELGYEYKINDDGTALVMVPGEDGRIVPVVIMPETNSEKGSFRLVMVAVAIYQGDGPAGLDVKVQRISGDFPLGVVKVMKHNGKTVVIYGTVAPSNPSASSLGQILRFAVKETQRANQMLLVA